MIYNSGVIILRITMFVEHLYDWVQKLICNRSILSFLLILQSFQTNMKKLLKNRLIFFRFFEDCRNTKLCIYLINTPLIVMQMILGLSAQGV